MRVWRGEVVSEAVEARLWSKVLEGENEALRGDLSGEKRGMRNLMENVREGREGEEENDKSALVSEWL